jgi:hypothetical protein
VNAAETITEAIEKLEAKRRAHPWEPDVIRVLKVEKGRYERSAPPYSIPIRDLARAILGEDGQSVDATRLGVPAATPSETGFDLECALAERPDWYDTHCPTCDAPEPDHTPTCAVPGAASEGDMSDEPAEEYTPTTDEVRKNMAFGVAMAVYVVPEETHAGNPDWPIPGYRQKAKESFDRWLAAHDREVAKRAWDEGYGDDSEAHVPRANPYRSGSEGKEQ